MNKKISLFIYYIICATCSALDSYCPYSFQFFNHIITKSNYKIVYKSKSKPILRLIARKDSQCGQKKSLVNNLTKQTCNKYCYISLQYFSTISHRFFNENIKQHVRFPKENVGKWSSWNCPGHKPHVIEMQGNHFLNLFLYKNSFKKYNYLFSYSVREKMIL